MENLYFQQLDWLDPWRFSLSGLEQELSREVDIQHPLCNLKALAVGRRTDNDDVLFYLFEHQPPFAVVHLTWRQEHGPEWPSTLFYDSMDDFRIRRMKADALEYESGGGE